MTFKVILLSFMKRSHFLSHIFPGTFPSCPFMWRLPKDLERVITKGYSISAGFVYGPATMDGKLSTWVHSASVACLPSVLALSAWQCQCQMSLSYWDCQLCISKHDLFDDIAACRAVKTTQKPLLEWWVRPLFRHWQASTLLGIINIYIFSHL